jgi:hypothetical protein
MDEVRARFSVQGISINQNWATQSPYKGHLRTIQMQPVSPQTGATEEEKAEHKKFWEASPSGEIKLGTLNPAAGEFFDVGDVVEVTFRKVGRAFPKPE